MLDEKDQLDNLTISSAKLGKLVFKYEKASPNLIKTTSDFMSYNKIENILKFKFSSLDELMTYANKPIQIIVEAYDLEGA